MSVPLLRAETPSDKHYEQTRHKIEKHWHEFDIDKYGVLNKIEAFKFVNKILKSVKGEDKYNVTDFDQWFEQNDTKNATTLEKDVIIAYIMQKIKEDTGY